MLAGKRTTHPKIPSIVHDLPNLHSHLVTLLCHHHVVTK